MMSNFAGTRALLRLALRRDRLALPFWLGGTLTALLATASAFAKLYPSALERAGLAASLSINPGLKALTGPLFNPFSTGGLTAWRLTGNIAVVLGLMNILLTVRHTRGEEESGRAELVGAASVGRYALLTSALVLMAAADVLFGVLVTLGLVAQQQSVAGSAALGFSLALTAFVFAAIAAVTAQLTETTRSASGLAGLVLGLSYLLRAAGDVGNGVLSWLSPIGWAQQLRPFADERWWVFVLFLGVGAAGIAGAFALIQRRDLGAGLLATRPGRTAAGPRLAGPIGLAWRLHRGILIGWFVAYVVLGAAIGGVAKDVGSLLDSSPQLADAFRRLGGGVDIVDSYIAATLGIMGLVVSGYVIQALLRIRVEETSLRAEQVLGAAVSRWRFGLSHTLMAAAGSVVILAGGGLGFGLVHGARTHDIASALPKLLGSALAQVPAAWALGGLTLALIGLLPRGLGLAWAALGVCVFIAEVGQLLKLPRWVLDLSPFAHTPQVPAVAATAAPLIGLIVVGFALGVLGLVGLRRRDIG
jgi:ABC-2 type transport system permease protein